MIPTYSNKRRSANPMETPIDSGVSASGIGALPVAIPDLWPDRKMATVPLHAGVDYIGGKPIPSTDIERVP